MSTTKRLMLLLIAVFLVGGFVAWPQSSDVPFRHWQAGIEASFYGDMNFGLELGLKYYPIRFVGIGAGVGFGGDIGELDEVTFEVGDMMVIADDGDDVTWFSAGLQLQSPVLLRIGDGESQLSLKADAGIRLPVPVDRRIGYSVVPNAPGTWEATTHRSERNRGGESCFLYFKPAVALDSHRCQMCVGYLWSNMDVYSGVRNVTVMGRHLDLPRRRPIHGLTLGFGYRF